MAKKEKVTIDFTTSDSANDEFVMYLVEEGPWEEGALESRLRESQARVYGAVDVAIDGHLARVYPESRGSKVRVQVDLHDNPPAAVDDLVRRLAEHIEGSEGHQRDIGGSAHIDRLRIVTKRP